MVSKPKIGCKRDEVSQGKLQQRFTLVWGSRYTELAIMMPILVST